MKQVLRQRHCLRLFRLLFLGATFFFPYNAWGKIVIQDVFRNEIGYTIEVKGGEYSNSDNVSIVYKIDKGLEYYSQTGELLSKDGIYVRTIKADQFDEMNIMSISPDIAKSVKNNETLIAGLNYAAQRTQRRDDIEVAQLQNGICVISEKISCNYISDINIEGDISICFSEGRKETGLYKVSFNVKNEGVLKVKDFFIDGSINILGGTVKLENTIVGKLEMTEGELLAEQALCRSFFMSGGTATLKEKYINEVIVGGDCTITGGIMNFNGNANRLDLPEGSTGVLNITGGYCSYGGVNAKSGTLNISDGVINSLNIEENAMVSLSGGKYNSINISESVMPEKVLASGYGYYTWDRKFRPDLPLSSSLLKGDKINRLEGIQVKNQADGIYTNAIFEAAKKAEIGFNGRDITVISKDIPSAYRYAINSEAGLCWLAIALNDYVNISEDNDFNGIDYLAASSGSDDGKYYEISSYSDIVLTKDLDMSSYDWISLDLGSITFDGQGHRIKGVKVKQTDAAFFNYCRDVYNLIVSGVFEFINDDYPMGDNSVAGLAIHCDGRMINCGVEQSTIVLKREKASSQSYNNIGGLVANTSARSIQNCYVDAVMDVLLNLGAGEEPDPLNPRNGYVGGLIGYANSPGQTVLLENCYFAGTVKASSSEGTEIVRNNDFIGGNYSNIDCGTCYTGDKISKTTLNENVAVHNETLPDGEIEWREWKDGANGPIHENGFSVIEYSLTLKVEGSGSFDGYFLTGEEGEEAEKHEFRADTTIVFTNGRTFHVTPKPDKGATLVDVVSVVKNLEGGVERLDSIPQTAIKANEEYQFLAKESIELVARFRLDTLYIENDTTVLGGSDETTLVDNMEISAPGADGTPAVVEIGNVIIRPEEGEAKTTITEDANVILKLSGTNNLGTLTNNGHVTIEKMDDNADVELSDVVNNGTLVDNTGMITEVSDGVGNELLSITNGTPGGCEVTEGETASLSATASVPEGASVTFEWQLKDGNGWTNVRSESYPKETRSIPVAQLRAGEGTTAVDYTDKLDVKQDAEGIYIYRCLVTHCSPDDATSPVSTTLSTYNTVIVSDAGQEPSQDAEGYYLIGNAEHLIWFRNQVNATKPQLVDTNGDGKIDDKDEEEIRSTLNAKLTADINLSGTGSWVPIGTYHGESMDILYYGTFDGQGHIIKGLVVNPIPGREDSYGLFGIVNGSVKNLGIVESTITGGSYVGAICGMLSYGTIENCFSTATVTGEEVGGLTGGMRKTSRVLNSYNAGFVIGMGEDAQAGGITSYIGSGALVENCYNAGRVEADTEGAKVGAIAGDDYHDSRSAQVGNEEELAMIDCYYLEGTGTGSTAIALPASEFVATINEKLFGVSSVDVPWKGEAVVENDRLLIPTFTEGKYAEVGIDGSPVTTYAITLKPCEGGVISADKTQAAAGDKVTLTATSDPDHTFESWIVKDATDTEVTVQDNSFVMPGSSVTVEARFSYDPSEVPVSYTLHFEENDGVLLSSKNMNVLEGRSITFAAEVLEGYDPATLVVEYKRGLAGKWQVLEPESSGEYRIGNVKQDIYVRAAVQLLDNPTSVEGILGTENTIRTIGGRIVVTVSEPLEARIVGMTGQLVRMVRLAGGLNEIAGLPGGMYIVVLSDGTRTKVLLR